MQINSCRFCSSALQRIQFGPVPLFYTIIMCICSQELIRPEKIGSVYSRTGESTDQYRKQEGNDMAQRITMADIAREAGVAKSTVSRYFNGGYVKDETREKIREVVERTGFEPSAAAQNLKLKETRMIGVVVPTMKSVSTGRLVTSMDLALHEQGYSCLIMTTDHHPEREISSIEYLRSMRVDGIVLIATSISEAHQKIQKNSSIPFLVMGQQFREGTSIIYDDLSAGQTVGKYADEMGHKDIVYLGVTETDQAVGVRRREGVMSALSGYSVVRHITIEETTFSFEKTRLLVRSLLEKHVPDLFICATDQLALACCKEVREKGLRIPEDVSLIGFGGYEVSELLTPSLTTIRFENELAGQLCTSTIIRMIHNEPVAPVQILGYRFLKGGSVRRLIPETDAKQD